MNKQELLQKFKEIYGVKNNKMLIANIIKDIIFYSLFLYVAFNSNSYCVEKGLPTVEEYQKYFINNTFYNFTELNEPNLTNK